MKKSIPPLLRGIGTLLILTAAVIAFCIARQHDRTLDAGPARDQSIAGNAGGDNVAALASEVRELRAEVEQDDAVEKVLENRWFDWISFAGTAVIAASFFTEAYIQRR